jgi:hypothetical protein
MSKPLIIQPKRGRRKKSEMIREATVNEQPATAQTETHVFGPKLSTILHLKCTLEELFPTKLTYSESEPTPVQSNTNSVFSSSHKTVATTVDTIRHKIGQLKNMLIHQNISVADSDCFWCTCSFTTPSIHIPTHCENGKYVVYGHFCSMECMYAHLLEEHIDESVKVERYQLARGMYAPAFGIEHVVIPAPDPHYMLSRYYGSLSPEEYRARTQNTTTPIMLVTPLLSRIIPELCEDNEGFMVNTRTVSDWSSTKKGGVF